jgi:hypothetical protein
LIGAFLSARTAGDGAAQLEARKPAVTWSVTGGTISPNGRYEAPQFPGRYLVIAKVGSKVDTAIVTVFGLVAPHLDKLLVICNVMEIVRTEGWGRQAIRGDTPAVASPVPVRRIGFDTSLAHRDLLPLLGLFAASLLFTALRRFGGHITLLKYGSSTGRGWRVSCYATLGECLEPRLS